MDIVYLHGIKADCVIGVWDWERRIRQTVTIDLDMGADISKAAASDDLEDTLNYKAVSKRIAAFVGDSEYQLVETLAEAIAGVLLSEFAIPWCRVRLNKDGAVSNARDVGIIVERGKKD